MTAEKTEPAISPVKRVITYIAGLIPFFSLPILGSRLYLRHDDSSWLLWAKKFTNPILYAFSPDTRLNMTQGFAQEIYWRPFINLYILAVYHILGPEAAGTYHLVACITFILAVFLLLRLVESYAGLTTALLTGLLFFILFFKVMYNLFHVGVPVSFLFQMGLIYFFWRYLETNRWPNFAAALLFLMPAMSRQTSPLLLSGLLLAFIVNNRKKRFQPKIIPAVLLIAAGFIMLTFNPVAGKGSVFSVLSNPVKVAGYLALRIEYYSSFLSSGSSGFLILFFLGAGVFHALNQRLGWEGGIRRSLYVLPALLVTALSLRFPAAGIYWMLACMVFLFVADRQLRMPLAWALASMAAFFSISFYHTGYLVEVGFPMSLVIAILAVRLSAPLYEAWSRRINGKLKLAAGIAAGLIVVLLLAGLLTGRHVPVLSAPLETVRLELEKNRNFSMLMNYIVEEIPEKAVIYELNEYDLGLTGTHMRFFTSLERAKKAKVMNLEHKREMFELRDRSDIQIFPAWQLPGRGLPEGSFLITCSGYEKTIAENRYDLTLVKAFGEPEVGCTVFRPAPSE